MRRTSYDVGIVMIFLVLLTFTLFPLLWIVLTSIKTQKDLFVMPPLFVFMVPSTAMRLWAEERKVGSIELLFTLPITITQAVLGKFLAAWSLMGIALLPSLVYYVTITSLGTIDNGPVVGGYLGLILMAGVFVSLGLFASSVTDNQIVAFLLGIFLVLVFFIIDKVLIFMPEGLASTLEYVSTDAHFLSMARGVIDSRDLVYFASILGFTLHCSVVSLERRKW